jgi:hypothetical protein
MSSNQPHILDATASFRAMWIDKKDPDTVYMDKRREVKPDIICVWQNLPFVEGKFRTVVADFPHMLYVSKGKPMGFNFAEKYGLLEPETWQRDLRQAFDEFMRVLEPLGNLQLKWNDNHISNGRFLACFPFKPKFGSQVRFSNGVKRKGSTEPRSVTSWFYFERPKGVTN